MLFVYSREETSYNITDIARAHSHTKKLDVRAVAREVSIIVYYPRYDPNENFDCECGAAQAANTTQQAAEFV
jgi:hypothetical protein